MKKRRLSIRLKMLLLVLISIALLAADGFFVYKIDQSIQERIITTYASLQDEAAVRIMHHMMEAYDHRSDEKQQADDLFVSYIQEEKSNEGTYWFLYRQDKILFEEDAMQTAMQDGKDLAALIEEWRSKGGDAQLITALFNGERQHVYAAKAEDRETESISAVTMQAEGRSYIVGSAVPLSQILQNAGYKGLQLTLIIGGILLAIIIAVYAGMLFHMLKKCQKMKADKEELQNTYRAELTRLNQELKERRRQAKDDQLMDPLALFYNREYFYTLLLNMKRQGLKSIGMIVIELESLHPYIDAYGLDFEQETLAQIKECLQNCILQECIIARVRENRIVITIISDDYRQMSEECNALEAALSALALTIGFKIYSIIQMPNESAMDMYQRIDQIISIQ